MKVRQRIPDFVDGVAANETEVDDMAGLLLLPWVAQWTTDPRFYRWCVSYEAHRPGALLMVEMDGGKEWWVVAFVDGRLDLPEWKPPASAPSAS